MHKRGIECRHGIDRVLADGLDVDVHRGLQVAMSQDRLYHFVGYAEAVEIRCQAATECMPALPFRQPIIALKFVTHFALVMGGLSLPAFHATVQGRQDHPIGHVVQADRLPTRGRE